jgi:hypothetical protein
LALRLASFCKKPKENLWKELESKTCYSGAETKKYSLSAYDFTLMFCVAGYGSSFVGSKAVVRV